MHILSLDQISNPEPQLLAAQAIFYESSSKKHFKDEAERHHFLRRYFSIYAEKHPEWFLLALTEDGTLLGYLAGTPDTSSDHLELNPYLSHFSGMFAEFPAHLHINFTAAARGLGLGSRLIGEFESRLKRRSIPGVHLITAAGERNLGFYLKNGYYEAASIPGGGSCLVLLGKKL